MTMAYNQKITVWCPVIKKIKKKKCKRRPAIAICKERGSSREMVETKGAKDINVGMIIYT
jgi:hypothetical protein